jgi:deoxyribodipyrimidine photo-lyase
MRAERPRAAQAAGPVIVWLRNDLRIADNPALARAAASRRPVLPLYILQESSGTRPLGGAARWWLHHSLAALDDTLRSRAGSAGPPARLVLRRGEPSSVLRELCAEVRPACVLWNRVSDPAGVARDQRVTAELRRVGTDVECLRGDWLVEPPNLSTSSGGPYRVFSAFWNRLTTLDIATPISAPRTLTGVARNVPGERLAAWGLRPRGGWDAGFGRLWTPGEAGAALRLRAFLDKRLAHYRTARDAPDLEGTSRLSPHLSFGEVSARQIWHAVQRRAPAAVSELTGSGFLRELGWREFARHLLHHYPELPRRPLRPEFETFRWRRDAAALALWQRGRTGYPIVDAGMRELWHTGWMHNRVRMIAASFLVKDLLLPWQAGESWFWDTLLDADLANNAVNWQWVAGCGADAAPYFRIFNPVVQSERFDPQGHYVRAWLPALRKLPNAFIHAPWAAPRVVLARAGVRLGETYPQPIVEHGKARLRALERFRECRERGRRR